ncbi:MAG: hypothetical protein D4S02_00105 [Rhodocyclaceae bacterium]|nr:MAG: hypothetical protein D4S02_00105 [Rhodocyclaceae bacterium]
MRHYAADSPEAIARVVSLALMADGAIDPSELSLFERHHIAARLGINQHCFNQVMQEFCEDMEVTALRETSGQLELSPETIAELLQDIRNPALQQNLLRAILDIVHADNRLVGSEAAIVSQAMNGWGLDLSGVLEQSLPHRRRWSFQSRQAVAS